MKLRARINPSIALPIILVASTAAVRLVNLTAAPARIDDEGTYVAEAYAVIHWGELAHYTYWYDHPPLGWLQLAAWLGLWGPDTGGNAVAAGRYLMVTVGAVTAALLWVLVRRVGLSMWACALALAVFALSPLAIALGRSVYLDNIAVAWLLATFVLICSPQRHLSAMFGAAACFGIAVLTKETTLLMLPTAVWLVWTQAAPATRRYALAVFGAVFAVAVSAYVLMAVVRGELLPGARHVSLWDGIRFQLWQRDPGGTVADRYSLKRHTIDGWVDRDPLLPVLAAPTAGAGLLVPRLRPFAVGLAILAVVVVRPGYLPVPLFITALPLIALILPGVCEAGLRRLLRAAGPGTGLARLAARAALAAGVLVASIALALWLPGLIELTRTDDDAAMSAAQNWIKGNVPRSDRLIVDDTLWVDLVRDGRNRRNVVWAYKVDSDPQVQAWSPHGWKDYDWIVSTPSMRANLPKHGVLAGAIAAAQPAAVFGSVGGRVELLHVGWKHDDDTPRALSVGSQLAEKLADTADARALTALQSSAVDRRALATLAALTATEPVTLLDIPPVAGEDAAGTPRRQLVFAATGPQARRVAQFFASQVDAFAVQSVTVDPHEVRIRFPLRPNEIGLTAASAQTADGSAMLRVADLRPHPQTERVDLVGVDGQAAGSVPIDAANPYSNYRTVAAGRYVATTGSAESPPTIRGVLTMNAGAHYTLTLFSGQPPADTIAELAPDGGAAAYQGAGSVRLIDAAQTAGPVTLAVQSRRTGEQTILADGVGYRLISGYAALPGGQYTVSVTALGQQSHESIDVAAGQWSTLVLSDGPGGPALHTLPDLGDATPLDPPTLAVPPDAGKQLPPPVTVTAAPRFPRVPIGSAAAALLGCGVAAAAVRRAR